jgi:uncharacterized protein YggE
MATSCKTPVLAVWVWLAAAAAAGAQAGAPATIQVDGRGAVQAEPDTAVLHFSVESSRPRAADAVAENARAAETLLGALKGLMEGEDRVRTTAYSVYPVYDKGDRLRPSGYRASNRVVLETRRIERVGDFIDAAAEAGAGSVGGLQFASSREAEHVREAAALAVRQAAETAGILAEAAGVAVRGVREIRFSPARPAPRFMAEAAMAGRSATPIEPGELTIDAEVTVVFDIQ